MYVASIWPFDLGQSLVIAVPIVLLGLFLLISGQVRDWLQVANLSNAAELALKVGAIVAAVVALNLFQLKPHLTVFERCQAELDLDQVVKAYGTASKMPLQLKSTLKIPSSFHGELKLGAKSIPLGSGRPGSCGRPRADLFARGSVTVRRLPVTPTTAGRRLTVKHPPLTPTQAKKASKEIIGATTVAVTAFVSNTGRGDATSVKVDQPPGLYSAEIAHADCHTPPFDIDSGERPKVVCYRAYGRKVAFTTGDFKAFGDAKPRVDDVWLWTIGGSLFLIVLGAILWEIVTGDWKPAPSNPAPSNPAPSNPAP
jgi:hypothetical protein